MSGIDLAYGGTWRLYPYGRPLRCPVLTERMVVPGITATWARGAVLPTELRVQASGYGPTRAL
eukprot:3366604-Rhodomonas_salina.2